MITILQNKLFIALLLALLLVAGLATLRQHTATASGNNLAIPTHMHEPPTSPPAAPLRQTSDDPSLWRELETPFEDGGIWRVLEDKHGNIWVVSAPLLLSSSEPFGSEEFDGGTSEYEFVGKGLARFEQGQWITYTEKSTGGELPDDRISDALFDREGNLWLAPAASGVVFCAAKDVQTFQNLRTFTHGNTNGGLVSDYVNDIFESNDGSLWFGTETGLSRYDGQNWEVVATSSELGVEIALSIFQDSQNGLWVSLVDYGTINVAGDENLGYKTLGKGVVYSAPFSTTNDLHWDVFTETHALSDSLVSSITEDSHGTMWVGTYNNGVSRFDGEQWETFTTTHGLPSNLVSWVGAGYEGQVWVGTNQGVARYDGQGWEQFGTNGGSVPDIFADSERLVWFAGDGVRYYTGYHKRTFNTTSGHLAADGVWDILEARDGAIWVATLGGGVSRYQNGQWQTFNTTSGDLPHDYVYEILEADDKAIWVRTYASGVSRYQDGQWQTFNTTSGDLPDDDVDEMFEARDGAIWVRPDEGGVSRYQDGEWQTFNTASGDLAADDVDEMFEARDGAIWVGTNGGGVSRYQDGDWQTFNTTSGDLAADDVQDILEARDGAIWVITWGGGVSRYQDGDWQTFNTTSGDLAADDVQDILEARDGAIWVATWGGGVSRYQNGVWQTFNTASGHLAADYVQDILEARDGAIWVWTNGGGVSRYQDGEWQTFNTASGDLAADDVDEMFEARDGAIWVRSDEGGVSRYQDGEWETFSEEEYQSLDVIGRYDTERQITDRDGFIWTATDQGAVRSYPDTHPPWVHIVSVNDHAVEETAPIVLDFEERKKVDITFEADDLATASDKLTTFFQLTGVYTDWQKTVSGRNFFASETPGRYVLRIDEIPPGQHTLRIKVVDEDGLEAVATQDITVAYPLTIITKEYYVYPLIDRRFTVSELPFLGMVLFGLPSLGIVLALSLRKQRQKRWEIRQHFNPYISELAVTDPNMFFGREEIINDIITNINASNFAIYGEKRIGKTSILHQVNNHLSNQDSSQHDSVTAKNSMFPSTSSGNGSVKKDQAEVDIHWLPLMISLHAISEKDFFRSMMHQIVVGVRSKKQFSLETMHLKYEHHEAESQHYNYLSFLEDLIALKRHLDTQKNIRIFMVLLVDEGDALSQYSQQTQASLRTLFMVYAKDYLRIVLAAEKKDDRPWNMTGSPWTTMIGKSYTLKQFTEQEARELITKPVPHYRYEKQAIELILERSQLVPRHIQNICREAVAMMLHEQKGTITRRHVEKALPEVQHLPESPQTSEVFKSSEISRTG